MKTKVFALLMSMILVISCSAVTASAAEITPGTATASSMVCYNLHGQYCITIPGSVMMTQSDTLKISADYLHLASNESVVISLSGQSFLGDAEYFKLEHDTTYLDCTLYAGMVGSDETVEIKSSNAASTPIVTFTSTDVDSIGTLKVVPQVVKNTPAGAYTGTLVFDISLAVASEE